MTGGDLNFIRAVTDKKSHKDISIMTNELKMYCSEHGYESPRFWPASYTKDFAVSLHMMGSDRWEEFDANVVFILGENGKNNAKLLDHILEELQEPVVLTVPLAVPANQQNFFKRLGLVLVPARWTNKNQEEYNVYVKGQMGMGGFVNLMEHVENIGGHVVAIRRPLPAIFLSFLTFKLSKVLY